MKNNVLRDISQKMQVNSIIKQTKQSKRLAPDSKNLKICNNCPYDDCIGGRCKLIIK